MELYEYSFRDRNNVLRTVQAETLDEALVKAGFNGYVAVAEYLCMAVVGNGQHEMGVVWRLVLP